MASLMVFGTDLAGKLTFHLCFGHCCCNEVSGKGGKLVIVIWVAGVIVKVSVFTVIILSEVVLQQKEAAGESGPVA